MADDQPRGSGAGGTRRLLLGGIVVAAVLFVAVSVWPLLSENKIGTPSGGANPAKSSDTTASRNMPAQESAQSTVGRSDPAGQEDPTGSRARAIKESSQPLTLSDAQRQEIRQVMAQQNAPRNEQVDFEMMVGASVPRQVELRDIPPEVTQVLNGFWGDQYVVVQDKLVIVDQHSRRVVAIVSGAV